MIYQTTKNIHPELHSYGCYFLSLIRVFEEASDQMLSLQDVNQIYRLCQKVVYVGPDAYIEKGGVKGVGQISSAVAVEDVYMCRASNQENYTHIIGRWSRQLPKGTFNSHFVLMDGPDKVAYDSWPNSKTVREGKLIDYRYIFAEAI